VELVIPEVPKPIVTAPEVAAPPPVKRSLILRLIDKVKRL
jgi:hypothetical protein